MAACSIGFDTIETSITRFKYSTLHFTTLHLYKFKSALCLFQALTENPSFIVAPRELFNRVVEGLTVILSPVSTRLPFPPIASVATLDRSRFQSSTHDSRPLVTRYVSTRMRGARYLHEFTARRTQRRTNLFPCFASFPCVNPGKPA